MKEKCSNCLMKEFVENLEQKFQDNETRKRAILDKVHSAFNKLVSNILDKKDPFNRVDFLEDLAELHILLSINKKLDSRFRYIVKAKLEELQQSQINEPYHETLSCSDCVYLVHKDESICSLTSRKINNLNSIAEWCPLKIENVIKTMEDLSKTLQLKE